MINLLWIALIAVGLLFCILLCVVGILALINGAIFIIQDMGK